MKLQDILNDRLGSKKIQVRRIEGDIDKKVTINNCKVIVSEDDTGYDIILKDGNSGRTWTLDPACDSIKMQ